MEQAPSVWASSGCGLSCVSCRVCVAVAPEVALHKQYNEKADVFSESHTAIPPPTISCEGRLTDGLLPPGVCRLVVHRLGDGDADQALPGLHQGGLLQPRHARRRAAHPQQEVAQGLLRAPQGTQGLAILEVYNAHRPELRPLLASCTPAAQRRLVQSACKSNSLSLLCAAAPQESWSENPNLRPSFRDIVQRLGDMEKSVQVRALTRSPSPKTELCTPTATFPSYPLSVLGLTRRVGCLLVGVYRRRARRPSSSCCSTAAAPGSKPGLTAA